MLLAADAIVVGMCQPMRCTWRGHRDRLAADGSDRARPEAVLVLVLLLVLVLYCEFLKLIYELCSYELCQFEASKAGPGLINENVTSFSCIVIESD